MSNLFTNFFRGLIGHYVLMIISLFMIFYPLYRLIEYWKKGFLLISPPLIFMFIGGIIGLELFIRLEFFSVETTKPAEEKVRYSYE